MSVAVAYRLFLCIMCTFFVSSLHAANTKLILVENTTEDMELTQFIQYLDKPELTLRQALRVHDNQWQDTTTSIFKLPDRDNSVWIRLQFQYMDPEPDYNDIWLLSMFTPRITIEEAYYQYGEYNNFRELKQYQLSAIDAPLFKLGLVPGEIYQLYVKFKHSGSSLISVKLRKQANYIKYLDVQFLIEGAFFGAIFVIFLFNLFIYIQAKQKEYFTILTAVGLGALALVFIVSQFYQARIDGQNVRNQFLKNEINCSLICSGISICLPIMMPEMSLAVFGIASMA